jgi:hypothetical protein
MRKLILLCASLCSMVLLFSANPAQALQVLWVASNGSDANNCFVTSPCATFQGAINKGSVVKINCLNSGDYGAFTITASITIDCGAGNIGNVNTLSVSAITINTSSAATIVLRHLALDGLGSNSFVDGILAAPFASGTLVVEDCTIQGFATGEGIVFEPSAGRGSLQVSDSRIFNNNNGILVKPTNNQIASVTLNRVELTQHLANGLILDGAVVAGTMRDSVVGANQVDGVLAQANQVFFTVEQSSIVANLTAGIQTFSAGSVVNVAASTIGGNGTGVLPSHGSLISFGDNHMSANGANGNFTSTTALR